MSFTEKIDVLELLVEILMEHEKKLDEIVTRLELLTDQIEGSAPEDFWGDQSTVDAIEEPE